MSSLMKSTPCLHRASDRIFGTYCTIFYNSDLFRQQFFDCLRLEFGLWDLYLVLHIYWHNNTNAWIYHVMWCSVFWCGVWCGVVWCGVVWCVMWMGKKGMRGSDDNNSKIEFLLWYTWGTHLHVSLSLFSLVPSTSFLLPSPFSLPRHHRLECRINQ